MKRVLIVDDNAATRTLIMKIIGTENYDCTEVSNAADARKELKTKKFHLIMSDIYMPGELGLDFVRFCSDRYPDTAIVLVTGLNNPLIAKEALDIGVYGYIVKPFEKNQFLIAVENALRRRKLEKDQKKHIENLDALVRERTDELSKSIKELKNAKSKLQISEERFRSVFENIQEGYFRTDMEGKIIMANPSAVKMMGYNSIEDIKGVKIQQFDAKLNPDKLLWDEFKTKERIAGLETVLMQKDGTIINVFINSHILYDSILGPCAVEGTFSDITDRKKMEKTLIESEKRLKAILENAPVGIAIIEAENHKIIEVNQYVKNMLGIEHEEIIGKTCHGLICTKSRGQCPVTSNGNSIYGHETEIVKPDGNIITILRTALPIYLEGKKHIVDILVDISERLFLETQLVHSRKLEAVGQLAAGIAHEINTPIQYVGDNTRFLKQSFKELNNVINQYEVILDHAKNGRNLGDIIPDIETVIDDADMEYLKDEIPVAIDQALEGVERVSEIVRSMKEFSHPGTKEKAFVDINQALKNTVTVSKNEWKYVADVEINFDDALPLVPCLPGELNQAFLNMIINSAQAIADVVGDDSDSKGVISISTRNNADHVEISIGDTGTGIKKENQARIFDPFFTTKDVGKGTGQGLAISHSVIVEKHCGELSLESEIGKGTTFIIRLPLQECSE